MNDQLPAKDDPTRLAIATNSARNWLIANAPGWVAGEITDDELMSLSISILTDDDNYRNGQASLQPPAERN